MNVYEKDKHGNESTGFTSEAKELSIEFNKLISSFISEIYEDSGFDMVQLSFVLHRTLDKVLLDNKLNW